MSPPYLSIRCLNCNHPFALVCYDGSGFPFWALLIVASHHTSHFKSALLGMDVMVLNLLFLLFAYDLLLTGSNEVHASAYLASKKQVAGSVGWCDISAGNC